MEKPKPVRYTTYEGGEWLQWKDWDDVGKRPPYPAVAHSVEFSDGSIFDMVNGWRRQAAPQPTAAEVQTNPQHPNAALYRVLEKVELACRRAGGGCHLELARELAKIIKDHLG